MEGWTTEEELTAARERFASQLPGYEEPAAYGLGAATVTESGSMLDVWFPQVNTGAHRLPVAVLATVTGYRSGTGSERMSAEDLDRAIALLAPAEACTSVDHPNLAAWRALATLMTAPPPRGGSRELVAAFLADHSDPPADVADAYLRLHLLSHRLVRPNETNMDGIFGVLNTVVWTDQGPFAVDGFELRRAELAAEGRAPRVVGIDKFPRMVDYVVPGGVRIADAARVRLGAHLAEGTVVMHEGFCNFNAGTIGPAMVEGRISQGVVVGEDSDIGGGASIMGTLSGGGTEVIRVGRNCLIGANGGIGISLGDNCTVEAGLYLTAGSIVRLPDGKTAKARELSGHSNVLYRRNSTTGAIEVVVKDGKAWPGLNPALH